VKTLFTLISPTVRSHLHLLSLLGYLLNDEVFRQALENQESREAIFTALRNAEERLLG
jgi:PTS system nitrogen regulatory IIA component